MGRKEGTGKTKTSNGDAMALTPNRQYQTMLNIFSF
jgi:hypothetical protein